MWSQTSGTSKWNLVSLVECSGGSLPSRIQKYTLDAGTTDETCPTSNAEAKQVIDCSCGSVSSPPDQASCVKLGGWGGDAMECELWIVNKDIKAKAIRKPNGLYGAYSLNCGNGGYTTRLPTVAGGEGVIYENLNELAGVEIPRIEVCEENDQLVDMNYRNSLEQACDAAVTKLLCDYSATSQTGEVTRTDTVQFQRDLLTQPFIPERMSCGDDALPTQALGSTSEVMGQDLATPLDTCPPNNMTMLESIAGTCLTILDEFRCPINSGNVTSTFWIRPNFFTYPPDTILCQVKGELPIVRGSANIPDQYLVLGEAFISPSDCEQAEVDRVKNFLEEVCVKPEPTTTTSPPSTSANTAF